jgi:chaperonin GroEL
MEEITLGKESRDKLLSGINKLANTVKVTLGPSGNTVIIADEKGKPYNTKDGVSVSNYIKLKDPIENIGIQLIKEAARKTADEAGDGTTTSTVLIQSFIQEGIKFLDSGGTYNEIKEIFATCIPDIVHNLKLMSTTISENNIKDVATISANNDINIGELVQVAFNYSTNVKVEEGNAIKDSIEFIEGVSYPVTYHSKAFITDESKGIAELDNPQVLLLDCKLDNINKIVKIIKHCNKLELPLVIITEFISDDVLRLLETNQINGSLKLLPIKSPGYAQYRKEYIKDISILTGATIVNDLNNEPYPSVLGELKTATCKREETLLIPVDTDLIGGRINDLLSLSNQPDIDDYGKKMLLERINNLNGTLSIIKVGGKSDIEMKERYDRIEDAVFAVSSALEEGVIPGGGITLYKLSYRYDHPIIYNTLRSPNKIINENGASVDPNEELSRDIVDPLKVTRCALENSASVALTILGTEAIVLNEYLW